MEVHFAWLGSLCFFICLEVGDSSNVLFKKDHCFGNGSLRQSYPELFKIAAHGDAFVFDYVDLVNGSLQWKPLFNHWTISLMICMQ